MYFPFGSLRRQTLSPHVRDELIIWTCCLMLFGSGQKISEHTSVFTWVVNSAFFSISSKYRTREKPRCSGETVVISVSTRWQSQCPVKWLLWGGGLGERGGVCTCMWPHPHLQTPWADMIELFHMQLNSIIPKHMDYCFLYWKQISDNLKDSCTVLSLTCVSFSSFEGIRISRTSSKWPLHFRKLTRGKSSELLSLCFSFLYVSKKLNQYL